MKIEQVYRDSHGTVWMYATCNVRRSKVNSAPPSRRKKRSTGKSLFWGICIPLLLMSIIAALLMSVCAENKFSDEQEVSAVRLRSEAKDINKIDLSSVTKPIVKEIKELVPSVQLEEPEETINWLIPDLPLNESLQRVVFESTDEEGVDYYTMLGLIQVESRFRSDAVNSRSGSYGLCQLNPKYFPSGLSDEDNIREGTKFLGQLIRKYEGDVMAALTAYNAGFDTGSREYATAVMCAATEIMEMSKNVEEVSDEPDIEECIGQEFFTIGTSSFTSLDLPTEYYDNIDFSSFQPYEDYSVITNRNSAAYSVTRSDRAYNDENGLRRYTVSEDQFSVNGEDDYVIALGTFYKPKGTCGQRYLIVTSTGYYTAIAGDEKSDLHTDDLHMFSLHSGGNIAGIIEWLVDTDTLNISMRRSGNIATPAGPVEELKGDILYIYLIEE